MSQKWAEIVEHLNGSCVSLDVALELFEAEELANDMEFLQYLDGEIFNCAYCNWWWELSEEASEELGEQNDLVCQECVNEELDNRV